MTAPNGHGALIPFEPEPLAFVPVAFEGAMAGWVSTKSVTQVERFEPITPPAPPPSVGSSREQAGRAAATPQLATVVANMEQIVRGAFLLVVLVLAAFMLILVVRAVLWLT